MHSKGFSLFQIRPFQNLVQNQPAKKNPSRDVCCFVVMATKRWKTNNKIKSRDKACWDISRSAPRPSEKGPYRSEKPGTIDVVAVGTGPGNPFRRAVLRLKNVQYADGPDFASGFAVLRHCAIKDTPGSGRVRCNSCLAPGTSGKQSGRGPGRCVKSGSLVKATSPFFVNLCLCLWRGQT